MDARSKFHAVLTGAGIPLAQFNPGSGEYALGRQAAIEAIEALEDTDHAILGGDVVKIANGRFQYTDNWSVERKATESETAFARRSREYGRRYVEEFQVPSDWLPLFVLVEGP